MAASGSAGATGPVRQLHCAHGHGITRAKLPCNGTDHPIQRLKCLQQTTGWQMGSLLLLTVIALDFLGIRTIRARGRPVSRRNPTRHKTSAIGSMFSRVNDAMRPCPMHYRKRVERMRFGAACAFTIAIGICLKSLATESWIAPFFCAEPSTR
jgi:hypothetical protein